MTRTPRFMSERTELTPGVGWRDCVYAAGMMLADKAGVSFPLGFTPREREALERSDDQPDETGASIDDLHTALQRRHGLDLPRVSSTTAAMRGPATTGIAITGNWHLTPPRLWRWDVHFGGQPVANHGVYMQPLGDGANVWLMDPLAPVGWTGEKVAAVQLDAFARSHGGNSALIASDPAPSAWRLLCEPGVTVQTARLESPGRLGPWTPVHMPDRDTARDCGAPERLLSHAGAPCTVALVTQGVMRGTYVHLGPGVTAKKTGAR